MDDETRYEVKGSGRMGSYAAAKRARRARNRQYWAICRWDNTPVSDDPIAPKVGWVEVLELGTWKTKAEAGFALQAMERAERSVRRQAGDAK